MPDLYPAFLFVLTLFFKNEWICQHLLIIISPARKR